MTVQGLKSMLEQPQSVQSTQLGQITQTKLGNGVGELSLEGLGISSTGEPSTNINLNY